MTHSTQPISPLRQRMIEDMNLRKLAPTTQTAYIRAVKKLADYLGHSPGRATAEDLRQFQLHLTDQGTSRITLNATITALRFFFEVTVGDKNIVSKLNTVPVPRKLPVVLSREEVSRLLEATHSLKYKAAFSVAYGAGLRISEVASLKFSDIDSERKTLHVEQGKGRKGRYAMLSPALLDILRRWWCEGHSKGLLLDVGWLFPGQNPVNPLSPRQLSRGKQQFRHKTMTLETDEFIRRFLIHVLPTGFHRIRHYGLLANSGRRDNLERARELLMVQSGDGGAGDNTACKPGASPQDDVSEQVQTIYICPRCQYPMVIIECFERGQRPRAPPVRINAV